MPLMGLRGDWNLSPGMEIGYLVTDAAKLEIETERDASFLRYYGSQFLVSNIIRKLKHNAFFMEPSSDELPNPVKVVPSAGFDSWPILYL
jgi:hypothetical protein